MVWKKGACVFVPPLMAVFVLACTLLLNALLPTPKATGGTLDLTSWSGKNAFSLAGEWEFIDGALLNIGQIEADAPGRILVTVPNAWNELHSEEPLQQSGYGRATYVLHIKGALRGERYGLRTQVVGGGYRLYVKDTLAAQGGAFSDTEIASAGKHRPQLAYFTAPDSNFDIVLQVENHIYGLGGMWRPILFGTERQIMVTDALLHDITIASVTCLLAAILFYIIFFAAQRGEKDALFMPALCAAALLRVLLIGDAPLGTLFPTIQLKWLTRLNYFSMPLAQFLLLYFVYHCYPGIVPRYQVAMVLGYMVAVSALVFLLPLAVVMPLYAVMNGVLVAVMAAVVIHLARAAYQARDGAPLMLGGVCLLLGLILYKMLAADGSIATYVVKSSAPEYLAMIFAQIGVTALRYRKARETEVAYLRGQIRPHFINNVLTAIIAISREKPDDARDLLVNFSTYLRGFYSFEHAQTITVSQEMEYVYAYAALEQARFNGFPRLTCEIAEERALLPPLTLQPLVENAFVHGLNLKREEGIVTVYVLRSKNGKLRAGVRDNGVGIACLKPAGQQGIALTNIDRRLQRLYRTTLVFSVPEGGGCEVYFEIPLMESKYENHSC